jgi:hypothetical protein
VKLPISPFVPFNPHHFAYKPNNKRKQEFVQVLSTAPWNAFSREGGGEHNSTKTPALLVFETD